MVEYKLGQYRGRIDERIFLWKKESFQKRLGLKDPLLWPSRTSEEIEERLGWVDLPEKTRKDLEDLAFFAESIRKQGFRRILLLGMGGAALAPEVFQAVLGNRKGYPELLVLDSTHPDMLHRVQGNGDPLETLYCVSSKSGMTLETLSLFKYFWEIVQEKNSVPGQYFISVTDPGTPLMRLSKERNFRRVFASPHDVGGRFSAFSVFGAVPAVLIGTDLRLLFKSTGRERIESGLELGAAVGEMAALRDKLTFLTSPSLKDFPLWLEQLIAESLGKQGTGVIPIVQEPPGGVESYGPDRFFIVLMREGEDSTEIIRLLDDLENKGSPSILITHKESHELGKEMYRWEVAIAAAGAILGINPFDQPDVEITKELTRRIMQKKPVRAHKKSHVIGEVSGDEPAELRSSLDSWLASAEQGDFIAIQAFLPVFPDIYQALQTLRRKLLERTRLASTLGFGPRFLHSTGQLHKGGKNTGIFLQLVDEPKSDFPVPEAGYSFRDLIQAQSRADFQALKQRGRRILRVNLKRDVLANIDRMINLV